MRNFPREDNENTQSYSAITSLNSEAIRRISSNFDLPYPLSDTDIAYREQLEGKRHRLVGFVPISQERVKEKIKGALAIVNHFNEEMTDELGMPLFPISFTDSPDRNGLWLYLNPKFMLTKGTLRLEVADLLGYAVDLLDRHHKEVLARRG
jgi:hypothetical protein